MLPQAWCGRAGGCGHKEGVATGCEAGTVAIRKEWSLAVRLELSG